MHLKTVAVLAAVIAGASTNAYAEDKESCRPTPYGVVPPEGYNHLLFAPEPSKRIYDALGFVASLDDRDDDDGVPGEDFTATAEWVSYQLNGYYEGDYAPGWERPHPWYRNDLFNLERRESGSDRSVDDSYSGVGRIYNRGHLANRSDLNRISPQMGCNTHDPANAVPQMAKFNQGIWLGLENYIASMANVYGAVWISAGPIYEGPIRYIGDPGDVPVAIPTHLWKTVAWIQDNNLQWRAWIYPNRNHAGDKMQYKSGNCSKDKKYRHQDFLVSLATIEEKTGLTMFPAIQGEYRKAMLDYTFEEMPSVPEDKFIGSCH